MELLSLTNGDVDLRLSLQYGPRIVHYSYRNTRNVLAETGAVIETPAGPWHARGGHRLWVAPESLAGSYAPDNDPVELHAAGPLTARLRQRTDAAGIEKHLIVTLAPAGSTVEIGHLIVNRTPWPITVAPWAISIVTADGVAVIPQPAFRRHADDLLPARPLVQWSFTDLTDTRWTFGRRLLSLTPDAGCPEPQKIGAGNRDGWCALVRDDLIFMKRFPWNPGASYPDFGCNNELYTAGHYLEMESLGPLATLAPGESAEHTEHWDLFPKQEDRGSLDGLYDHLAGLAQRAGAGRT
jgi:hypothetical protein